MFEAAASTGKAEGVFERRRKSGERFTASVSITLRRNAAGTPIGYLLISKDITEQKRLEEQLTRKNDELEEQYRRVQEANRLKSEFLANMSHELRTPLNAIIGFSELMYDGKVGVMAANHQEYLGDILTSSKHLLQLINDVLDLAKVESGKMEFHYEPVILPKIIGEVRDVLRTLMSRKRINVTVDVDEQVTDVITDSAKLKQVLYNYLSNALKFTPEEGSVNIRALAEGPDFFRIDVRDSGIGIKQEDMHRLFIEFQQLDASMAKKYQGTGLGLALTKRMAEAQGGRVEVNSQFGKGSVFSVVLPRAAHRGIEMASVPQERQFPRQSSTVLIVDDNANDRDWFQQALQHDGYQVDVACDGAEALRRCRSRRYDAILLDLILPDIDGWEVARDLRAEGPNSNTPIIVVSVLADTQLSQVVSIQEFLTKPVSREDLAQALEAVHITAGAQNRILVVDDDPAALQLITRSLTDLGYRPLTVSDARQGLEIARRDRLDAVILDLLMPGIDGFEFLRLFRRIQGCAEVPVIIWTVKDVTAEERRGLQYSAQAIVVKGSLEGFTPLLNELRKLLAPSEPTVKRTTGGTPETLKVYDTPKLQGGRKRVPRGAPHGR